MKVEWTSLAQERFREQQDFIARSDYEESAQDWAAGIIGEVSLLEASPHLGRVVPEIGREDIRELVYKKKYCIFYKVARACCYILSIRRKEKQITSTYSF